MVVWKACDSLGPTQAREAPRRGSASSTGKLGAARGDSQYLFYRGCTFYSCGCGWSRVRAGQGFWVWVGWCAAVALSLSARHSLPPSASGQALLQQTLAFTLKTTIPMCACPLGDSLFQTRQLVWLESSAACRVGWGGWPRRQHGHSTAGKNVLHGKKPTGVLLG